jgi:hypothetical protein
MPVCPLVRRCPFEFLTRRWPDAVAAQPRVGAVADGDTRQALAGDVAALQLQPPLGTVHPVPLALAADLAKRQVGHPADAGLKHQCIGVAGLDLDVGDWAVPQDLQGLVDHQPFLVEPRSHQDAVTRPGRLYSRADAGEVAPLVGVHWMSSRS